MPAEYIALVGSVVSLVARLFGHGEDVDIVRDGLDAAAHSRTLYKRRAPKAAVTTEVTKLYDEFFRIEFRGTQEHDISAAIHSAQTTVERAHSFNDLLDLVTDSASFDFQLRERGGHKDRQDLGGEDSKAAYDSILRFTTAYLAELTLRSPGFTSRALQRLLKSQAAMATTLENLRLGSESARQLLRGDDEFRHRYLRRVVEQLDFLEVYSGGWKCDTNATF